MEWWQTLIVTFVGGLGAFLTGIVAFVKWRSVRRDAERQGRREERRADMDAYDRLIDSLQARIDAQDRRIGTLEQSIGDLRDSHTRLVVQNANLQRDVADRDAKIVELEDGIQERDVIIEQLTDSMGPRGQVITGGVGG